MPVWCWLETQTECCPALTHPVDGAVDNDMGLIPIGETATYNCSAQFVLNGASTTECTATGWSITAPKCECPALSDIPGGTVTGGVKTGSTVLGGVARYQCAANLVMVGTAERTCVTGIGWNEAVPACHCAALPNPVDGRVDKTTGTIPIGDTAIYTCNLNFVRNGEQTTACTANGWSKEAPTCDCGSLVNPVNGEVTYTDTVINNVATYTCADGYRLQGSALRTCVSGSPAIWSPTAPICEAGKLNDDCSVRTLLCKDIQFAECRGGLCRCLPGYNSDGTGYNCTEIDECQSSPCLNGGSCNNEVDRFTCTCDAGWNGTHCQQNINDCLPSPCLNGATCQDGVNTFTCNCTAGYKGPLCATDINECLSSECKNGSTCVDLVNAYKCVCPTGYTGGLCETDINECAGIVCKNGGTCVDQVAAHVCNCVSGFTGTACETNIDNCEGITCNNTGVCLDGINTFSCACDPGWEGTLCQIEINECNSNPCKNGGACTNLVNKYNCTCLAGYIGNNCETNKDECAPDPCIHGTCEDRVNDYLCTCEQGYTGKNCDNEIDECLPNMCQNAATCVDLLNAYECQCPAGYSGTNCEYEKNECLPNPCQNGASCQDGVNSYTCTCVTGFTGKTCETNINECASSPCLNGGTCTDLVNGFECACKDGYTGVNCRPAVLGDDCSIRPVVCSNILNSQCTSDTCQCMSGFEKTAEAACSKKNCGNLAYLDHGRVDSSAGTLYAAVASFTCNTGYVRSGTASVTCTSAGTWSDAVPTCTIRTCQTIAKPPNGDVVYSPNRDYLSRVDFTCSPGYILTGSTSRTCQANGAWDGTSPTCVIKGNINTTY
ncbi:fibropellin-1-like [Dreissena polymorpha]|uniref:fibropellin-1-like n=1 Tax=Dreissena polymorpha TaxID=45954 RepID=UPI002263B6E3|nr:fibropellin-1-like [Dreissena polymorpha]